MASTAPIGQKIVKDLLKKSRLKDVVKEITSGKPSDDAGVAAARRAWGGCCSLVCCTLIAILITLATLVAAHQHLTPPEHPTHRQITEIMDRWMETVEKTRTSGKLSMQDLLPITGPQVADLNEDVIGALSNTTEEIVEETEAAVEEVVELGEEVVDDLSKSTEELEEDTEIAIEEEEEEKEKEEEEEEMREEEEASGSFNTLLEKFRPGGDVDEHPKEEEADKTNSTKLIEEQLAKDEADVLAREAAEKDQQNREAGLLPPPPPPVPSAPPSLATFIPKHTTLSAPQQCVLRGITGTSVLANKDHLAGFSLPQGSVEDKIRQLLLVPEDLVKADQMCQFLTRECVETMNQSLVYDRMEEEAENIRRQGERLKKETEAFQNQTNEERELAKEQARHSKEVLKHYFESWVPEHEGPLMELVDDFETRVLKPAMRLQKQENKIAKRPHKDGELESAVEDVQELSAWAVAKSYHKLYDADQDHVIDRRDPFARAHDLSFRLEGVKQARGMASQALHAASSLGQPTLAQKLKKKVDRLDSVLLALRAAYNAAREAATMLQGHLDTLEKTMVVQLTPEENKSTPADVNASSGVTPQQKIILIQGSVEAEANLTDEGMAVVEELLHSPPPPPPPPPPQSTKLAVKERRNVRAAILANAQDTTLPRVPESVNHGFMGRCAYVPDIDAEVADRYKHLITEHDTLIVCNRDKEVHGEFGAHVQTSLFGKSPLEESASNNECTFVTLAHQKLTPIKLNSSWDASSSNYSQGSHEDVGVEHTSALTVSVDQYSFKSAEMAVINAHLLLAQDPILKKAVARQQRNAGWGFEGKNVSPDFVTFVTLLRSKWCQRLDMFGQPNHLVQANQTAEEEEHEKKKNDKQDEDEDGSKGKKEKKEKKDEKGKKKRRRGFFGRRLLSERVMKKRRKQQEKENKEKKSEKIVEDRQAKVLENDARREQELYMMLIAQHVGEMCLYSQHY